jgi:predicted Rossmann fold nucleotide-binding protein DprA/Smf involved in DNA uptake
MRAAERGFLLLGSNLGNPDRRPLTTAQLRVLADRAWKMELPDSERDLEVRDFLALGYSRDMATRIVALLSEEDLLEHYLRLAKRYGCLPLTRVSEGYPLIVRKRLGLDSPSVLWAKGDLSLLETPKIALVGSRDLQTVNREFAREVGKQAALQGCTLVSGNARGADRTAQEACLAAGGNVVVVVADELAKQPIQEHVLYLSEEDYELAFSAQRAISRNRVIHSLGSMTFVAQSSYQIGGTWDGTVKNLRFGWSPVFCYGDGSPAVEQLKQMGAETVDFAELENMNTLLTRQQNLFDQ